MAWSERDRCVADPDRGHADVDQLLSAEHTDWLASRLSPDRAQRFVPTNRPGGGTVYLCAADADGMMVSLIESNYMGFGSGIMGGSTGIMLHNRGASFTLDASHPNALAPSSRPLHTLMPGMLLRNGVAEVALGSMGGDAQPHIMVQLVTGLVDDGSDPQSAVDRPRFVLETEAAQQPLGPGPHRGRWRGRRNHCAARGPRPRDLDGRGRGRRSWAGRRSSAAARTAPTKAARTPGPTRSPPAYDPGAWRDGPSPRAAHLPNSYGVLTTNPDPHRSSQPAGREPQTAETRGISDVRAAVI